MISYKCITRKFGELCPFGTMFYHLEDVNVFADPDEGDLDGLGQQEVVRVFQGIYDGWKVCTLSEDSLINSEYYKLVR